VEFDAGPFLRRYVGRGDAGGEPLFAGIVVLSLAQIGLLLGAYKMSSSLTQPIFGYLSDCYGGRWFAVGGALWTEYQFQHGISS